MTSAGKQGKTERAGALIGRAWRAYLRGTKAVVSYVVPAHAKPTVSACALLVVRAVPLFVVSPMFIPDLWTESAGLLAVALLVLAAYRALRGEPINIDLPPPPEPPEYRMGPQGTGYYDEFDNRVDDHDPNNPDDMY